jgi:threonine synthase
MAPNIHNIAVQGNFDDAQALVKAMFNDASFAGRFNLSAVNSINWARLMLQTVYYFYAAVRLGAPGVKVNFAVPTGNFGDVFAGYVAAQMGLPIGRLIVATNVNDILARALANGDYSVGHVEPTAAPSMDIQVSSNFERLLFDLYGRDAAALTAAMQGFEANKKLVIPPAALQRAGNWFDSHRVDADEMALTLRWAYAECGELIDPHTAIGLAAARAFAADIDGPVVTLATAHPAKFRDAVERASGVRPTMPARVSGLFDREERFDVLPAELGAVEEFIAARAVARTA